MDAELVCATNDEHDMDMDMDMDDEVKGHDMDMDMDMGNWILRPKNLIYTWSMYLRNTLKKYTILQSKN